MNSGEVVACLHNSQQDTRLVWREGKITAFETASGKSWNARIAPPLLDLQVNGYGGVDFQSDSITLGDLISAVRQLRRDGCAQIFLTLITDSWPRLLARVSRLKEFRSHSDELKTAIAGWHIEGPFLSHLPGFHGAHNPSLMIDPSQSALEKLLEIIGNDKLLLTLAPEREGSFDAIDFLYDHGATVSLGHTNADAKTIETAVQFGARSFTHLGNGCPQQLDRHDNILWRVFDTSRLIAGLIPDKIHVAPLLFRTIYRQLGTERIWLTTDAVAPAGAPPGRYTVGAMEVDVGADQIVRLPGRTNFAGSALRPIDGVLRAAEMLGQPWQKVWDNFSRIPRNLVGLPDPFAIGADANFCLIETNESGQITKGTAYFRGEPTEIAVRHPYC